MLPNTLRVQKDISNNDEPMLNMTYYRQHRKNGINYLPLIPFASGTYLQVTWDTFPAPETHVRQRDSFAFDILNQRMEYLLTPLLPPMLRDLAGMLGSLLQSATYLSVADQSRQQPAFLS